MTLRQELLAVKKNEWLTISLKRDKNEVLTTIKQLQEQGEQFRLNDDETKFMSLSNCFFDLKEEQGYSVVKVGRSEQLMYNGKILAIR